MRGIDICTMSTKKKTTDTYIHSFLDNDHSLVELIWEMGWHHFTDCHVSHFFLFSASLNN